jgi:hypothetical protein
MAAATEVWGVHSVPSVSGAHTLQTLGAIYADGASMGKGTATVTNAYGLYANAPTVGSNNWSIYSASGTNYFGGNVGIGTMAPGGKLAIAADSNNLAFANAAGTNKWWEYLSGNDLRFWDTTDRVTFQSGGNVGIGTTGPNDKLQIYGGASNTALTISTDANLTSGIYLSENSIAGSASAIGGSLTYDGANNKLYLQTGTTLTPRLTIERDTGNVIIGATAAGATAAKTLALTNSATDPTTSADLAHLYAKDISAGNAALAIYAETAAIVAAAIASTHKIPIYYNNAVFYLLASDV